MFAAEKLNTYENIRSLESHRGERFRAELNGEQQTSGEQVQLDQHIQQHRVDGVDQQAQR